MNNADVSKNQKYDNKYFWFKKIVELNYLIPKELENANILHLK